MDEFFHNLASSRMYTMLQGSMKHTSRNHRNHTEEGEEMSSSESEPVAYY